MNARTSEQIEMSWNLNGKTAIVTGGGQGIGRAIAQALAGEGARVAVCDIRAATAEAAAAELRDRGSQAIGIPADVSDASQVEAMVAQVRAALGPINILVNNAGIQLRAPLAELAIADWDRTLAVNLRGPFLCTRAVLPDMIAQRSGKIINISSDSGKAGWATGSAYCASKFGLIGMTESVAREVANYNINVNAICPGGVDTPMSQTVRKEDGTPYDVTGWLQPDDIAAVAVFLASDASRALYGASVDAFGRIR
jgi:3-oxoacyl-[acyl-carrier protein] reductase